jgi:hypothetical protein
MPITSWSTRRERLCDELDDTTGLLDLLLGLGGEVAGADNDGDLGETTLAENLGVAEVEEVEDGSLVALLGEVLIALLSGDERPELVEVDDGLPEVVLLLVEVAHTNLSEVTRVVLVDVGPVVVLRGVLDHALVAVRSTLAYLTTSHTTTSGMLPVLSDTSVTGGDVTAVLAGVAQSGHMLEAIAMCARGAADLVGMLTAVELVS